MSLIKIEVMSCNEQILPQPLSAEFDESGGNIGRAEENTLVLQDPERHISRIHASIIYREGSFAIRCQGSALPIYLNDRILNNGQEAQINQGDKIRINHYLMRVTQSENNPSSSAAVLDEDPFAIFDTPSSQPVLSSSENFTDDLQKNEKQPEPIVPESFDANSSDLSMVVPESKDIIPSDFDPFADPALPDLDSVSNNNQNERSFDAFLQSEQALLSSAEQSHSVDPLVLMNDTASNNKEVKASQANHVPERYAAMSVPKSNSQNQQATFKTNKKETHSTASKNLDTLSHAFLNGAGVPELNIQLTPELMTLIGQLLRVSTQGTLELLLARSLTKQEVRANVTLIAPHENNPLKFSPNVEAALKHLLSPQDTGFMEPLDALQDAHDDLKAHQFGFIAGMRAALADLLQRFDPQQLEQRLTQKSLLDSLLPANHRAKLWDLFVAQYEDISHEAEDDFHSLFGKEFLKAYEEQIAKLNQGKR